MPRLEGKVIINTTIERCFDLARSIDFHADAAGSIKGQAVGGKTRGLSENGDSTRWQATFFGFKFRLTTQIQNYSRPSGFSDVMTNGLFKSFSHEYRLTSQDDQTLLEDTFVFESRLGFLGKLFDRWFLLKAMRSAQEERLHAIQSALENSEAGKYLD